jgi:DNA-nicking Smr family endonuclease
MALRRSSRRRARRSRRAADRVTGGRELSAEEARLWRRIARSARPIHPDRPPPAGAAEASSAQPAPAKAKPKPHAPAPVPVKSIRHPGRTPEEVADAGGHRKVRRGKLDIEARIDLHGLTQHDARTLLARFVALSRGQGMRCVLVVTGKGRPIDPAEDFLAPQPGVIRRRLPEWLSAHGLREHVSGYAAAHLRHGGPGAFYVLLKARS